MKTKIFNVLVYTMLGWSVLSAVYLALPVEYQSMIPEFNWLTALISGGSTGLLGTGALAVQSFLNKAKATSNDTFTLLKDNYTEIVNEYKILKVQYTELQQTLAYNNELLKTELKTKLSNPMITAEAEQLIKQVITNDQQG